MIQYNAQTMTLTIVGEKDLVEIATIVLEKLGPSATPGDRFVWRAARNCALDYKKEPTRQERLIKRLDDMGIGYLFE